MPSFGTCAALAASLVGAVVASPAHMRRAIHQKKDIPQIGGRGEWFREGVLQGQNAVSGPIAMDNDQGAYVVEFFNKNQEEPLDIVIWSSTGQVGDWTALTINVTPANVTTQIPAGGNLTVSFNPEQAIGQSISGAWCPMYSNTPVSTFGGCDETWGEFTFQHNTVFSTVDVSRLVQMNGTPMTIQTFAEKGGPQACLSDMETCVYKCADGLDTCPGGECSACGGSTGCMGMGPTQGYAAVYLG